MQADGVTFAKFLDELPKGVRATARGRAACESSMAEVGRDPCDQLSIPALADHCGAAAVSKRVCGSEQRLMPERAKEGFFA